jgi:Zn-dependent protease
VDPEILVLGLTWFVVFVFSTTLHEAAHAFVAHRLGDSTAYHGGQASLNPLPHIQREPVGMVLVPLISFAVYQNWMIGWASAPYDPQWSYRYPRRAALMAMAGPAANLLIALVAGVILRIGMATGHFLPGPGGFDSMVTALGGARGAVVPLSILFSLNVLLCVFNLLPMPPLDGSAILQIFLSESTARRYQELVRNPAFSLIGLLVAWKVSPYLLVPVFLFARGLLYAGA